MINPVKAIINCEEEDFKNYLIAIHLFKVFEPLFDLDWVDRITFKQLVRYIVKLYSLEGKEVVQGYDWRKNKKRVYDNEGLPEQFWLPIGMLEEKKVRDVIQNWLNTQDEDTLTQLKILKDLRVEMQSASISPIKKTGDPLSPIDYSAKFDCAKYAKELGIMAKDLESTLIQNRPELKDGIAELKQASKNGLTVSPATFSK